MPVIPFERIPLPSLRTYTTLSVCLLICGLIYSHQSVMRLAEPEFSANPPSHMSHQELLQPSSNTPSSESDKLVSDSKNSDFLAGETSTSNNDKDSKEAVFNIFINQSQPQMAQSHQHDQLDNVQNPDNHVSEPSLHDDKIISNNNAIDSESIKNHHDHFSQVHKPVKLQYKKSAYEQMEYQGYGYEMTAVMLGETSCIWIVVNMAYCCLILVGKLIQHIIFGKLRVSEFQHLKDKFWNFVFYKFIFIFGVLNVQTMEEVVLWCSWFSILGFLDLLAQLCKDRFEYLSFSPSTTWWTHTKVLGLLLTIQLTCSCLLAFSAMLGYVYVSLNTFSFMAAECVLMVIKTSYVITRYGIHLRELNHEGVWENRAVYTYYAELIFELAALSVDFVHHVHMLLWSNIFLSMASLVICLQLRFLFHEFQRRIRRHKNYRRVVTSMEARFPLATAPELDHNNDDCAICWEHMENARKLPCGHLFHNACLRSWLEQDISCPTCRTSLSEGPDPQPAPAFVPHPGAAGDGPPPAAPPQPPANHQTTNHFFHFDGSRYVSWLPSFSVEVTHTQLLGTVLPGRQTPAQSSQLDNLARQVQDVFPHLPIPLLVEDLRHTSSVELTIENIIEGRLAVPPNYTNRNASTGEIDGDTTSVPAEQVPSPRPSTTDSEMRREEQNLPTTSASLANFADGEDFIASSQSAEVEETAANPVESQSAVAGSRFSKASGEREEMLVSRKSQLLEQARKRFFSRQPNTENPSEVSASSEPSTSTILPGNIDSHSERSQFVPLPNDQSALRRRQLAYEAAARRMQHH